MNEVEADEYMNELLDKGAYTFEGIDPDTGEALLGVNIEIMEKVDPQLLEIYRLATAMEVEETLIGLEAKGLITRIDEDNFELTEAAKGALEE